LGPARYNLKDTTVHIQYSEEAEAFRSTIRRLLDENLPEGWVGVGALGPTERAEFHENWKRTLHHNGLLAVSWPKEYGGADLSLAQTVVLNEEMTRAGAVLEDVQLNIGMNLLGRTLMELGTPEQKARFLPRLLSGEDRWCQGFSEPGAGSDLAGLSSRATLDGDEWVINGQKIWTSEAHMANWIFVLSRTDPDAPKHKGMTFLLVPMDQPGVEVRQVVNINGSHDFNEVFFTDAKTSRDLVVGDIGEGWNVASVLLGFERGGSSTTRALMYRAELDRLMRDAQALGRTNDPVIRQRLAEAHTRVELMRYVALRTLTRLLEGGLPGPSGSIFKMMWSLHHQAVTELAVDIIGTEAVAPSGHLPADFFQDAEGAEYSSATWVWTFLAARSDTIRGGTTDIQRDIIGNRILGLPKEPRSDRGPWRDIPR
jgi:alkylation response protein AidB-like acyl-CoA dehydrogenase